MNLYKNGINIYESKKITYFYSSAYFTFLQILYLMSFNCSWCDNELPMKEDER